MGIPRWVSIGLRLSTILILAFIYIPIGIIVLYSFNAAKVATWPITSFTIDWYVKAFSDQGIRDGVGNSVEAAVGATLLALLFGSLLGLAVARHQFFGRQSIAFIVILPLALPAVLAGSIFTFSLTLGDYITPGLVSNNQFIGNVVFEQQGVSGNLPLAAAFALVPVGIMAIYLFVARRLGAFEAL